MAQPMLMDARMERNTKIILVFMETTPLISALVALHILITYDVSREMYNYAHHILDKTTAVPLIGSLLGLVLAFFMAFILPATSYILIFSRAVAPALFLASATTFNLQLEKQGISRLPERFRKWKPLFQGAAHVVIGLLASFHIFCTSHLRHGVDWDGDIKVPDVGPEGLEIAFLGYWMLMSAMGKCWDRGYIGSELCRYLDILETSVSDIHHDCKYDAQYHDLAEWKESAETIENHTIRRLMSGDMPIGMIRFMWERLYERDKYIKRCRSDGMPRANAAWRIRAHQQGECKEDQKWLEEQVKTIFIKQYKDLEPDGRSRALMIKWLRGEDAGARG
jgi:hypothetical protein